MTITTKLAGAVLTAAFMVTGCGGSSTDLGDMESEIQTGLTSQLQGEAVTVSVSSVDCVRRGDDAARCIAQLTGDAEASVPVDVSIDGDEFLWEVSGPDLTSALGPALYDDAVDEACGGELRLEC